MTQEFDHGHQHASSSSAESSADHAELHPGRASRSALMRKPDHAIVSGLVQRKGRDANGVADGAEHAVAAASGGGGSALPEMVMRKFESSLGTDLSSVRVHTGEPSAVAANAVGARAYTMGSDIHFAAGQYDPSSSGGQHLLAHEVAHTVQQSGGAQRMQFKLEVSSPGDHLEHEADRAADAMLAGAPASVSGASGAIARKKPDQSTEVIDPETYKDDSIQSHENVATDGHETTWDTTYQMADGSTQIEKHSGLDMYGAAARAKGVKPDPADPYATQNVAAFDWSTASRVGPADPGTWNCTFAPKQPLPVLGPDSADVLHPGALKPIPVQESQIAFAQSCVNAFQAPYAQTQSSWDAMSSHVKDFQKAGEDPMFQEGGLNWLPNKAQAAAHKGDTMEQIASTQTVGGGKTTVADVNKMTDKDAGALKSTLSPDKQAKLEKAAGKPAVAMTLVQTEYKTVDTLNTKQGVAKARLITAQKAVSVDKLVGKSEDEKVALAAIQAKQKALDTECKLLFTAIDIGIAFAAKPEEIGKASYSVLKAFFTQTAASHYEKDMKKSSSKIKQLGEQIRGLNSEIAVDGVIAAASEIETNADGIAEAKTRVIVALKLAEDAHEAYAKEVGDQIGGKQGEQVRAAIEALPKVALVAQLCETIVAAIKVPGFSEKAGIGMLGAAESPQNFMAHCGEMNGYKTSFSDKAKQWSSSRARLEEIAKSYGLGNG